MGLFKRKPAIPWFESDELEAYLARSGFDAETEAFVRAMAQDGVAPIDLGDAARALCDQVVADTDPYFAGGQVGRVQDAWYRSKAVKRLADQPKVRRLLRAAYGRDPFPFQTLNFQVGSQQKIHSDTIHFHSAPERFMCGVWVALEDVRPEAGPLVYHPGSHRLPVMTMRDAGVNHPFPSEADYGSAYVPRYAERIAASGFPERHAVIPKGWAFVWAANLAHGGSAIAEIGSTRRSLVVHNFFEDCIYYTPMASDVEAGRLAIRLPHNIRTGLWAWPRRNGWPIRVGQGLIREAYYRDRARRPAVD